MHSFCSVTIAIVFSTGSIFRPAILCKKMGQHHYCASHKAVTLPSPLSMLESRQTRRIVCGLLSIYLQDCAGGGGGDYSQSLCGL